MIKESPFEEYIIVMEENIRKFTANFFYNLFRKINTIGKDQNRLSKMTTEKQIIQAIAEHLGVSVEDLDRHALLREELDLGPIELNDLLVDLSQKFDVSFDSSDIEGLRKIDDLIVLIEDNLLD